MFGYHYYTRSTAEIVKRNILVISKKCSLGTTFSHVVLFIVEEKTREAKVRLPFLREFVSQYLLGRNDGSSSILILWYLASKRNDGPMESSFL